MYKKTQYGMVTAISLGFAIVLTAYLTLMQFNPIPFIVIAILIFALLLTYKLTVSIDEKNLNVIFGIGIIRKRFPLKDIVRADTVKNHWYYGWGIRYTPHGWLFNVSGLDAVEIELGNGKTYRIGTADPEGLRSEIVKNSPAIRRSRK